MVVTVFKHGEFDIRQRIDEDGNISMPLLKVITIAGLTVREAEKRIEDALYNGRLLAKPQVTISIVDYSPKHAVVLGQVVRPGTVTFPFEAKSMRLIDVISLAGGLTRLSKDSAIRITHTDDQGEETVRLIDISAMLSENKKGKQSKVLIYPDDVIFVPERLF